MNYLGISCGFHDAAATVIDPSGKILFAGHSERYSKIKNDHSLCSELIHDIFKNAPGDVELHYYEKPWLKAIRQLRAGQELGPFNVKSIIGNNVLNMMKNPKIYTHKHHLSHAAAGFQTSPFDKATVVVIDAIGELDTITIWNACYDKNGIAKYKKIWSKTYPDSIGLFYSAMTKRVGLKPLDEEYILMGMAAYGSDHFSNSIKDELIENTNSITFKKNLHLGVEDTFLNQVDNMDIASSSQQVVEELIENVMLIAKKLGHSSNLVYGGGVALNCLANRLLGKYFENIWIMPNPGDAGNSLGAAALGYKKRVHWNNAYLGYNIEGEYPVTGIYNELIKSKIVGVASGRAEFGPRALGNRSLLADPRGDDIKDKVNEIKQRQKFRPFAPVILEEHLNIYFKMPPKWENSRYMQVVGTCKYPEQFPAIVHHDGTSRIQTVPKGNSGIRKLLEHWYKNTNCPMLLNTSLNIRGEPMVNDRSDADRFQTKYKVKVFS